MVGLTGLRRAGVKAGYVCAFHENNEGEGYQFYTTKTPMAWTFAQMESSQLRGSSHSC